jgi:6-pyruvoyltetrahydropterin/6-carboxytetrahydropterin synthase
VNAPLVTVTREAKFDAAHSIPGYPGKCRETHGHTWLLAISVTGPVMDLEPWRAERGMVVDMGAIKDWLALLTAELDHSLLNNVVTCPTTERVLLYIAARAQAELNPALPDGCWVSKVALSEQPLTPRFWAEVVLDPTR